METLQRLHNRGSISTGEYEIDNSLKLEADNTEYMHKTPTSSGNRKTFTLSAWIKRTELGANMNFFHAGDGDYNQSTRTNLYFLSDDRLRWGGGSAFELTTTQVFRDTSAWYHIVMAVDTTQATSSNRLKLYINGTQVTDFDDETYPTQDFTYAFCKDDKHSVGYNHTDTASYCSLYIAEACLIDGTAHAPTSFGEYDSNTGVWKPKDVSGLTFGTNGFYLDFEDSSNLGNDASGGTDFTLNNITSADQALDTPTNNFCTMSPIINFRQKEPVTKFCTNGATYIQDDSSNSWRAVMGSVFLTKGKWYWEVKNQWSTNGIAGIHTFRGNPGTTTSPHGVNDSFYFVYNKSGSGAHMAKYIDGTSTSPVGSYETAFNHNDYACFSLDLDNDTLTVTQNGSSAGTNLTDVDISSITALGPVAPLMTIYRYSMRTIFGGFSTDALTSPYQDENGYGNFKYAVPSGFYAICSKNLAEYG